MQTILGSFLIRWLRVVPEWRQVPDDAERIRIADAADRLVMNHPAYYLGVCATAYFGVSVAIAATGLARRYLPFLPMGATGISIYAVLLAAYYVVIGVVFHRRLTALVRKRLLELGIPICLHCGYDLRGQTEPRCPECGRGFDRKLIAGGRSANGPSPATMRDSER
jgi:hypothetical protein